MDNKGKAITSPYENAIACELFDHFVNASTFKSILSSFQRLCEVLKLRPQDYRTFYSRLKSKLRSWKAQSLWTKIDKRTGHKDYIKGKACANNKVLIIGAGPCGLRTAIEAAMLGAKVVVVEKRDRFSRNNVIHLWPLVIHDLRNLGAKKFFGKFCAGSIDHISIRQLQCILLKVALCLGIEIQYNVEFLGLIEPPEDQSQERIGWRANVFPENHSVSKFEFDVLLGADGKRNTLQGFKRKEFRGKLAIAITANFINRRTEAENRVEEISGVAFIFNQKFFQDLKEKTAIDLENIVYYKDDTHYFVMTAKKHSLREKGVILNDYNDAAMLLSRENVDQEALLNYAREAAAFSTNYQLPVMEFALNHYGKPDVAMFDFTSMFAAENASRIIERQGHKLLLGLVGDSLLEPFWPTGSGCARGFLGSFDAAWMIRSWALDKMTPLQVLAERESIYRLLAQTTPENLNKNLNQYHLDPNSRYPNLNANSVKPFQVRCYYDTDGEIKDEIFEIETPAKRARKESCVKPNTLLSWCQKQLEPYNIVIENMTTSWKNGLALCALIHLYRPELINFHALSDEDILKNNQLAFEIAEQELGIPPVLTAKEMAQSAVPDKLTIVSYLAQFYEIFKYETPQKLSAITPDSTTSPEDYGIIPNRRSSSSSKFSILGKISSKISGKKKYSLERERESPVDKENDKRKSGNVGSKKRQSPNNDKNDILLTRFQRITCEINLEDSIKTLEKRLAEDNHRERTNYNNDEPNLSFEEKVKDLDKKFRGLTGKDRRPQVKVNKIDHNEVLKLDQKFREGSGQIDRYQSKDLPTVKQDIFVSKVLDMDRKLRGVDDSHSKFQYVDNRLKKLDTKLRDGVNLEVGSRGANKVSAMAEQFSSMVDSKQPEPPASERRISRQHVQIPSGGKTCYFCNNRVYLMEQMSAEGLFFHRNCFKCEYCGASLRLGNYTFDRYGVKGGKFYCVPHFRMEKPGRSRKRSMEEGSLDLKSAEVPTTLPLSAMPPAKDLATPSPISTPKNELIVEASRTRVASTPERIEFENAVDVLSEDEINEMEEEEVTKHNLGSIGKIENEDDEESEEESSSDEDDAAFSSDVEEKLHKSLTWDEACQLAESWKRRHSLENLVESSGEESGEVDDESSDDEENGYEELESEEEEDDDDEEEEDEDEGSNEDSSEETTDEDAGDNVSTPRAEVGPAPDKPFSSQKISYGKESHPIALKSPEKIVNIDLEENVKVTEGGVKIPKQKETVEMANVTVELDKKDEIEHHSLKNQISDKSEFKDIEITMTSRQKHTDKSGMMDSLTEKDLSFDLKFVTLRRKKRLERTPSQDSGSSFTLSTPSGSPKSSTSSLTLDMLEMEPQPEVVSQGPVDSSRQAPIATDEIDETYRTESSEDTSSRPNSVLSLPDDKTPVQSPISYDTIDGPISPDIEEKTIIDDSPKKKIPLDRALLESVSDVKEFPDNVTLEAEKGRKKIGLSNNLKKTEFRKSIEDMIDIPFADEGTENDSDSEVFDESQEDIFYTPMTSKKPERPKDLNILIKVTDDTIAKQILPELLSDQTPDKSAYQLNNEELLRTSEREKQREAARLRAKSKTDEELGLSPPDTRVNLRVSQQSNKSDDDNFVTPRASVSHDDLDFEKCKRHGLIESSERMKELEDQSHDQGSSESKDSSDEQTNDVPKHEKRKSFLEFFGLSSSDSKKNKPKKEKSPSSSGSTPVEKRSKLKIPGAKEHAIRDKRHKKTQEELDSILNQNSKFYVSLDKRMTPKLLRKHKLEKTPAAKAAEENFSCTDDTEEELLDEKSYALNTPSTERRKQKFSEEDFQERLTRKVQKAAQRLHRQEEMKRLRMAQEIQRKLEEVAVRQQELEERGIIVEKALRGDGEEASRDETDLMQEWFNLVHEKNVLVRYESELMVRAKELELEDRHGRLQQLLREKMAIDDRRKTMDEIEEEGRILAEMLDVVEQRDNLVAMMEEERLREQEEDKDLGDIMEAKGFHLSPVGVLKKSKATSQRAEQS